MSVDGLIEVLNIETLVSEYDHVEMRMPITPDVLQPFGFLHGGATIALLESAASLGAANSVDFDKERPFGVDVHVRHKKSGIKGFVKGVADLERTEGNKQFWKVTAYDDEGDILSEGVVMAKIVSLERLEEKKKEQEAARKSS